MAGASLHRTDDDVRRASSAFESTLAMTSCYPRVLVATPNNFNLITGGGVTLTNLFRGWPPDRLVNLHQDVTPPDRSVCCEFFRLSDEELVSLWRLGPLKRARGPSETRRSHGDAFASQSAGSLPSGPDAAIKSSRGKRFVRSLLGGPAPHAVRLSPQLSEWVNHFQAELIYTFLGSIDQMRLVRMLAERYSAPLAVHFMDDWPSVLYAEGPFAPILRSVMEAELKATLDLAAVRLGISEAMCTAYRKRYGGNFLPFHNAVDLAVWEPQARRDWSAGDPLVVRYVGSVLPEAQLDALIDVAKGIGRLRAGGHHFELWIHSPNHEAASLTHLDVPPGTIRIMPPPDDAVFPALLASADVLVLPFNFDSRSAGFLRFSMPTKVPAYMVSGTPVLVYGPPQTAPVRYAAEERWGHVVDTKGPGAVAHALLELANDRPLRERLGRRAHDLATERHDAATVRSAFQKVLRDAASAGRAGN